MRSIVVGGVAAAVMSGLSFVASASDQKPPEANKPEVAIASEGRIGNKWMLAVDKLAMPQYPDGYAKEARDVCIALGYEIAPDGSTSGYRVLKQWNSQTQAIEPVDGFWANFANAGVDAVSQWKFKPRPEVTAPQPVFTVATLTWQTRQDTNPATLRGKCRIDDLAVFLRNDGQVRGLNDHLIERTSRAREDRVQRYAGTPKNQPNMTPGTPIKP